MTANKIRASVQFTYGCVFHVTAIVKWIKPNLRMHVMCVCLYLFVCLFILLIIKVIVNLNVDKECHGRGKQILYWLTITFGESNWESGGRGQKIGWKRCMMYARGCVGKLRYNLKQCWEEHQTQQVPKQRIQSGLHSKGKKP